jgi:hypothetical protein
MALYRGLTVIQKHASVEHKDSSCPQEPSTGPDTEAEESNLSPILFL